MICICDACIASCADLLAKAGIAPFATITEELAKYADERSRAYEEETQAGRNCTRAPIVDDERSIT